MLWEEMHRLRDGDAQPASANAVTNAAGTLLRSVKLEMEYARMLGRSPAIPLLDGDRNNDKKALLEG